MQQQTLKKQAHAAATKATTMTTPHVSGCSNGMHSYK